MKGALDVWPSLGAVAYQRPYSTKEAKGTGTITNLLSPSLLPFYLDRNNIMANYVTPLRRCILSHGWGPCMPDVRSNSRCSLVVNCLRWFHILKLRIVLSELYPDIMELGENLLSRHCTTWLRSYLVGARRDSVRHGAPTICLGGDGHYFQTLTNLMEWILVSWDFG
jgi:hypothetical protein